MAFYDHIITSALIIIIIIIFILISQTLAVQTSPTNSSLSWRRNSTSISTSHGLDVSRLLRRSASTKRRSALVKLLLETIVHVRGARRRTHGTHVRPVNLDHNFILFYLILNFPDFQLYPNFRAYYLPLSIITD